MKKSVILLLFTIAIPSFANADTVRSAFRNGGGDWIVELSDGSFYWGSESSLQQLDMSWESKSDQLRDLTLSGAQVEINSEQAEVSCGEGSVRDYTRASDADLARIRQRLAAGRTHIKNLPRIEDPAYLFQDRKSGDYIYVATPRYNFHGNYVVFRGKPGKMHRVETLSQKGGQAGLIQFKDGGGIYVPSAIVDSKEEKNETAMLIDPKNGKKQPLVIPRLSRGELARLGVRESAQLKAPRLPSPCDSLLRSAVAKSDLGDGT